MWRRQVSALGLGPRGRRFESCHPDPSYTSLSPRKSNSCYPDPFYTSSSPRKSNSCYPNPFYTGLEPKEHKTKACHPDPFYTGASPRKSNSCYPDPFLPWLESKGAQDQGLPFQLFFPCWGWMPGCSTFGNSQQATHKKPTTRETSHRFTAI